MLKPCDVEMAEVAEREFRAQNRPAVRRPPDTFKRWQKDRGLRSARMKGFANDQS